MSSWYSTLVWDVRPAIVHCWMAFASLELNRSKNRLGKQKCIFHELVDRHYLIFRSSRGSNKGCNWYQSLVLGCSIIGYMEPSPVTMKHVSAFSAGTWRRRKDSKRLQLTRASDICHSLRGEALLNAKSRHPFPIIPKSWLGVIISIEHQVGERHN